MAMQAPVASDKKRVKVYELRENDWFDRGTGFCTGQIINDEPRIYVESEDQPDRMLLETRIIKDDSYQKQQDTLIVWTEPNGTDMALSFQEAEGCAAIWDFVHQVQQQLLALADDGLSDDALDNITTSFTLNPPELGNLDEVDQNIRGASLSQAGREALSKFLVKEEYLLKLIKLVEVAEDLESLPDLHRLCNIMKALILMNDNTVIEYLVTDDLVLGVVGALEYDPDFPTHKANHRQYLSDETRFKEVVEIKDEHIRKKIRQTWRLQYLKDVVLARILDDPTFGVLNSLIFFHQVDIVQHLQSNGPFLKELFSIFMNDKEEIKRKEQGVHFVQQCCAIAKTLQMQNRATLLNNFISNGLFNVITFAVRHPSAAMRTTGIDILVALLDHDPNMMRGYMLKAVHEKRVPLTDTFIELIHVETDLGVKNQLADAIKILLDPQPPQPEGPPNRAGGEYMAKMTRPQLTPTQAANEQFAQDHFDRSCKKLFIPLKNLEHRQDMNMSYQEMTLFTYLLEILTFFVRQHSLRSRPFVSSDALASRAAQLLQAPQKPLKLTALKLFRTCIALQDQFYTTQVLKSDGFDAILNIVIETMPRDNLLNSACLELFEFICKEAIKEIITHLGQNFRIKLQDITYVDTFQRILIKFDQLNDHDPDLILFSQDDDTTPINRRHMTNQWALQDMDAEQEAYFNTSDDEDEEAISGIAQQPITDRMQWQRRRLRSEMVNDGASPVQKPLVDYPDEEEEDELATPKTPATPESEKENVTRKLQPSPDMKDDAQQPPERIAEKRRRQEGEEEDELDKLSIGVKRRNSTSSNSSLASNSSLRRRKGFLRSKQADLSSSPDDSPDGKKPRKIAISLSTHSKPDEPPDEKDSTAANTAKTN
ncbi:Platinum sensitivity protein [Knufia obscura]|uniref:Platinum sensitivity protein n=2 Tax=Knufia TaxID=430999 RepID=A0AAN8I4J0_9EURO|nr:Platinum sensitivity protein [Knufia obscura]KAK5951784.1 Platinum sensitivity protein [Knufia fluminis]